MKKEDFFYQIEQYGITLSELNLFVNEVNKRAYSEGVFKRDENWFQYSVDERNNYQEKPLEDENVAFENMYNKVMSYLRFKKFTNKFITRDIVCTKKEVITEYLKTRYSLSIKEAEESWDYLKRDFRVLNEFKYFVLNDDFVPENTSYKVQGYSAKQLYESTYLEVLGAYNYLIYLRRNPKEALDMLKKGLPRK